MCVKQLGIHTSQLYLCFKMVMTCMKLRDAGRPIIGGGGGGGAHIHIFLFTDCKNN